MPSDSYARAYWNLRDATDAAERTLAGRPARGFAFEEFQVAMARAILAEMEEHRGVPERPVDSDSGGE